MAYSITQSLSLFDAPGTEAFASENFQKSLFTVMSIACPVQFFRCIRMSDCCVIEGINDDDDCDDDDDDQRICETLALRV